MYRSLLITTLLLLAFASTSLAQITLNPPRIIMGGKQRTTELRITNPTSSILEVNVDFLFEVIRTDSLGIRYSDSVVTPEESKHSATEWLKIFPRRFTIAPGAQRLIRMMCTVPEGTLDGEYMTQIRFFTQKRGYVRTIDTLLTDSVGGNMGMTVRVWFPVMIRVGDVNTGVDVTNLIGRDFDSLVVFFVDMKPLGNSSYRGTMTMTVNQGDQEVAKVVDWFGIMIPHRQIMAVPPLKDGEYTIDVLLEAKRPNSQQESVIAAETVRRRYAVTVRDKEVAVRPLE